MNVILSPEYQLRPMQMADLDAIAAIEPTLYSHPWSRGNFSDSIRSGHSAWVLIHQNEIIGYSVMMMVLDEASLLNISIAKPFQKQGLGRYLLTHMLDKARQHKALNMFLEVRPSNVSAVALYEKMGFCEMAIRRDYYPANKGREDAILMGMAL